MNSTLAAILTVVVVALVLVSWHCANWTLRSILFLWEQLPKIALAILTVVLLWAILVMFFSL